MNCLFGDSSLCGCALCVLLLTTLLPFDFVESCLMLFGRACVRIARVCAKLCAVDVSYESVWNMLQHCENQQM